MHEGLSIKKLHTPVKPCLCLSLTSVHLMLRYCGAVETVDSLVPSSGLCPKRSGSGRQRAYPSWPGELCEATVYRWRWRRLSNLELLIELTCSSTVFILSPGACLQLFGSSKNGFGFRQSDLDICMMLEGQETIDVRFLFRFTYIGPFYPLFIWGMDSVSVQLYPDQPDFRYIWKVNTSNEV